MTHLLFTSVTAMFLQSMLILPSKSWRDETPESSDADTLVLSKMLHQPSCKSDPVQITLCLTVNNDLTWSVAVQQHSIIPSKCSALKSFPPILSTDSLHQLHKMCDELVFCAGQPDIHFVSMVKAKKGKILSEDGKVVAFVDECRTVLDGIVYQYTVRSSDCELVSMTDKCVSCQKYRANLRAMYSRWSKRLAVNVQTNSSESTCSSHTNDRYLNIQYT